MHNNSVCLSCHSHLPAVLWYCWLGVRKNIQPVKNWVMWCRHSYLSGFAYGPTNVTATPSSLASLKSRMVLPFCLHLTQVVLEKRPLIGCSGIMSFTCFLLLIRMKEPLNSWLTLGGSLSDTKDLREIPVQVASYPAEASYTTRLLGAVKLHFSANCQWYASDVIVLKVCQFLVSHCTHLKHVAALPCEIFGVLLKDSGPFFHHPCLLHSFNSLFSRTTRVSRHQKSRTVLVKTNLDLLEQETVSGSGINWAICKSVPHSRQIPCQHPTTQFFTGQMPFLPPNQLRQYTEGTTPNTTGFVDCLLLML